jgi:hypothetical protein
MLVRTIHCLQSRAMRDRISLRSIGMMIRG